MLAPGPALLSEAASTSYAAAEVLTVWGDHPTAAPSGTRYRAGQFPFWEPATSTTIIHLGHVSEAAQLGDLARAELLEESGVAMHQGMLVSSFPLIT